MAQPDYGSEPPPASAVSGKPKLFRRLFGLQNDETKLPLKPLEQHGLEKGGNGADGQDAPPAGPLRRSSRQVVTGLPRKQTFKRQLSEQRMHLTPNEITPHERRAVSVDWRTEALGIPAPTVHYGNPRASAPGQIDTFGYDAQDHDEDVSSYAGTVDNESLGVKDSTTRLPNDMDGLPDESMADTYSMTTSHFTDMIQRELESVWILNLSMHFRDRSKREKFFVTYREEEHLWRRVTISLDYRNAVPNSLEWDLTQTELQREKSAKIYEAIRESLPEIQFYETVTNLKLQTVDGRLVVHVVEDGNETINYPRVNQIKYLGCRRIKEKDIDFESHMSGFVYKVNVDGTTLIKKEIPSPETIDEFLYEINALSSLHYSEHVVDFYGVVVDDDDEVVKGLLISYAEQGALIDIIYDHCKDNQRGLPWPIREHWARQIVQGLADIHDSGFVQGDFTLSNIVIDARGDAKIIDINRRGCPVGWEPPEASALIESNQRISMYIGVKSDLYQLGMVLWGLAMQEDEPEREGRPLILGPEVLVPDWYRQMTEICLSYDPRMRHQASTLLQMFPNVGTATKAAMAEPSPISVDNGHTIHNYLVDRYQDDGHLFIREVEPPNDWPPYMTKRRLDMSPSRYDPYAYTRGRSPPSPLPSDCGYGPDSRGRPLRGWAANLDVAPSYSDILVADEPLPYSDISRQPTPTPTAEGAQPPFAADESSKQLDAADEEHGVEVDTAEAKQLQQQGPQDDSGEGSEAMLSEDEDDAKAATPDTVKEDPIAGTEEEDIQPHNAASSSAPSENDGPDSLREIGKLSPATSDIADPDRTEEPSGLEQPTEQDGKEDADATDNAEKHAVGSLEQKAGDTEPASALTEAAPAILNGEKTPTATDQTATTTDDGTTQVSDSPTGAKAHVGGDAEKKLHDDDFDGVAPAVLPTLTVTTDDA
ncbi:hypothetical protein B0I35DRAFT_473084 [Stachybotrys elegans]|uniref:Protein kinase domain-containing protein n=1 Tax=Stachybotrys elegans TaxID=80388 RepID=A0A8K0T168_9HYPO|nr:hypothetical protein B0I35DRAFT_473084 [Stachybotrys elegans]